MPRNGITQFSSLSPYILKLKQEIFHLIFPNNWTCPCGLDLTCATTQWWLHMMVPPKINSDDSRFIHSVTRSFEDQLGIHLDWVDWRCIDCRPLKCTTWFTHQLDLDLLRSLILFILLLLLFTWSAWPWFIDCSIPLTRPSIWILLKTAAIYQLTFYGWLGGHGHKDSDPGDFPLLLCHDQYLLRLSITPCTETCPTVDSFDPKDMTSSDLALMGSI